MWCKQVKWGTFFFPVLAMLSVTFCSLNAYAQTDYLWPIRDSGKYGKFITSAFAEYRSDRLHAGMDIKTIWRDGHKVVAVDDGSLYRLRVSPSGYGRAIYIRLKDGNIVIYAHLRSFEPKIQKLVDEEQQRQKRFSVDLWFEPGVVPVKRGEVLATTGRSGTRLQHLHFELRDRYNRPINPIANGFTVSDVQVPRPTKISIRPMNIDSHVEGDWQPVIKRLSNGKNGVFTIETPITVWGDIGISMDAYDRNGTYDNNYGIYSLKLLIDGKEYFSAHYDYFSYNQNRLVNLDRDYRLLRRDKGMFQKLFVDNRNSLPFYGGYRPGDGIVSLWDADLGNVPFEIIVGDFSGNTASVKGVFKVQNFKPAVIFPADNSSPNAAGNSGQENKTGENEKPRAQFGVFQDYQDDYLRIAFTSNRNLIALPTVVIERDSIPVQQIEVRAKSRRSFAAAVPLTEIENLPVQFHIAGESSTHHYESIFPVDVHRITPNGKTILLPSEAGTLSIARGDLYDDIWLRCGMEQPSIQKDYYEIVSDIVHLEPKEVFLRSDVELTLHYPGSILNPDKLGLYAQDRDGDWHFIGEKSDRWSNSITVHLSSLETVSILQDTIPPAVWRMSPGNGATITNKKPEIAAWFDDEMSGIADEDDMGLFLDGEKLIAEWDPILRKIFYRPKKTLESGSHTARFVVNDRMNNTSERTWNFTIR